MDLICRKKLLDCLKALPKEEKEDKMTLKIFSIIDCFPQETAVEKVVRCRDCKYIQTYMQQRYGKKGLYIRCLLTDQEVSNLNGYCCYGEEKGIND